jgi:uncharacterized membrane protein affecting hemolysin expression
MNNLRLMVILSVLIWLVLGLYLWYRYGPDIYFDVLLTNYIC